jgi:membrane fusion protein (multidrug efflux system)
VIVVPATAVLNAPFGDSVYIIEQGTNATGGLVVRQQFVRIGRMRGDYVAVETGVKPGDKVVSSGLFKLRNGMSVVENNELTPKSSATPKPADS